MVRREIAEYLEHLEKERDVSPHTLKAYGRDLEAFTEFCDRHYGSWKWETVDRLGLRGFLGEMQRRGLSKRSASEHGTDQCLSVLICGQSFVFLEK